MRNGKKTRERIQETYNRALHVLARMRRTDATLTAAAREEHIDPRTVRKYLASELRGIREEGRTLPTKSDRRRRDMLIPTMEGMSPEPVHGSEEASRLGRYMAALSKHLRTGDTDVLREFEGQSIAGHLLITDPEQLSALAQAGALQLDEIYALPEASS
jgi:hypothetical protein